MNPITTKAIETCDQMADEQKALGFTRYTDALRHLISVVRDTEEMLEAASFINIDGGAGELVKANGEWAAFLPYGRMLSKHPDVLTAFQSLKGEKK